ncbi:DNA adenine methylase [Mesoplasma lactucae]|uniref:site-specific DNA-methyltransferase (adenine-specific) n=1 Tax=Mesoplasma lactucae ATCC 49193 TaxID=81460 RepID=A0A291ISQ4_9MOLU|nr:DNA adenine methylase [Mesoplasma lactucae]ATG97783.1 adenine methyltransferase [Mesoplasma lactucae ATCC 49193]ATZ20440.1 adenine methyltransferase [Mesoplasma lactucae ATCC 49193]MCL8216612.1 Modification methylase FokI [Mesoplasma lactucae ATCC 49193]
MFEIENRRYTGNKQKLMPKISEIIKDNCEGEIFCDIFAGTGAVSNYLKNDFKKIIVNDFLFSNNIVFEGFWGKGNYNLEKLKKYEEKFNIINSNDLEENYFSKNFGNKYFEYNDSKKIGYIRQLIENEYNSKKINLRERSILIASLLYSADKVSNTVGHYEAYLKKNSKKLKSRFQFNLINAEINNKKFEIYQEDSNELIRKIKCDILFVDPPYNSRQYSRFYHVLETLTKWDFPDLHGVAMKPEPENMSNYSREGALNSFKDLIDNANTNYIVVTYNNTFAPKSSSSKNKISFKDLEKVLETKGETKVFPLKHKQFSAGKTDFDNHLEYVFVTEVYNG